MAGRHNGNGYDPRHSTETPDVSHIKNLDVTHEASDISVSGVLKFVLGLTVMTVVVFLLMAGLFRFLRQQEAEKEPDPGPMALKTEEERLPPEPRLQAAKGFGVTLEDGQKVDLKLREPEAEYRVLRAQWEQRLKCKSADHEQTETEAAPHQPTNCTPIQSAMDQILQGGALRVRPGGTPKPGDSGAPTAWSSGRVSGVQR